jgi:hypothetical protein
MTHVRAAVSATIVAGAALIAALVVLDDPSSDLAKIVVGGWVTALGNVIGYYFGARAAEG